jgi:alkylation response protein AidB-like acyl-CoA dehydrogenase
MDAAHCLDAARALAPRIAAAADQADRDRALPPDLVGALADAGLFRLLVPRSLGGAELDLLDYLPVVEEIARADASTAWCVHQSCVRATTAAWLDPAVAAELFGHDRGAAIANGPLPGRAVAVPGGYRLSGRWSFASGCRHATWLAAVATVVDGDAPRRRPDGSPDVRHLILPAEQARLEPSWDVAGLRATGSDTFVVDDLFVPAERAVSVGRDALREPGPLYRLPMNLLFASGFAAVALGTAAAAIEAFVELAGGKTPRGDRALLRDQSLAQLQIGQAEAHRRAGRAYLLAAVADAWAAARRAAAADAPAVDLDARAALRLAATHAIQLSAQAVDLVYAGAGASAIYAANPIQRCFQDVHVATQHLQGRLAHYESVGRHLLGLPPDLQWL